ncbi:uncharacterized protein MELLADRAFT_103741 [Melampsora larici-populina 98AG31]|uniref:ATPase dynein-related AAA domain-containing protein n=1 Tax=Melampsora larici-populina (strain 98AG31 / pathotype 3-4-7) TaxID=747676 RepID=F4RC81_MELLP|nr:uncharacterized protein MELLADRAFT_103741 [Melampsora larici-populina 98AG31]EGG09693.1 hypothetical protein MELLADRAFT_103741 [Melampsora larici-populina 98AG31]
MSCETPQKDQLPSSNVPMKILGKPDCLDLILLAKTAKSELRQIAQKSVTKNKRKFIDLDQEDSQPLVGPLITFLAKLLGKSLVSLNLSDQSEASNKLSQQSLALFTWKDGSLVQPMQELNSLLEPSRSIMLTECGGATIEEMQIEAHPSFEIMVTMNPGGDLGKRKLSPALQNQLEEIWAPLVSEPAAWDAIFATQLSTQNQLQIGSLLIENALSVS